MKPDQTTIAALSTSDPIDDVVTVEETEKHLGLFGDTSERDTVIRYIEMSVQHIEKITGKVLVARNVTDVYAGLDTYLDLSQDNPSNLQVSYINTEFQPQPFSGFMVDTTPTKPRIVVMPDQLLTVQLSKYAMFPVSVDYKQTPKADYLQHARETVLHLCTQLFYSRGESNLRLDDSWVYRLLEPFRNKMVKNKNASTRNNHVRAVNY